MKLSLSDEDLAFRGEVRAFLVEALDPLITEKVKHGYPISKEIQDDWTRTLNARGWAAPNWPVEDGGTGWSMLRRHLFEIELRDHHAPETQGFGFSMVGPAIVKYGSQAQKRYYLPKILNAEISWCQGYSEPGAGSDLAGVATRAVVDGDDYVVNGSKIWTSAAERADHIFMLVRTDPNVKPQLGITFLIAEMDSPGIAVEPLMAFNGKRLWNQVFFEDVRVPRHQILGEENRGWTVAKNLLGNERLLVSRVAENRRVLSVINEVIARHGTNDEFTSSVAELTMRLEALDATARRLLTRFDEGFEIGAEPSMLKLKGSQLVQDMDRLLYELTCHYGLPLDSVQRELDEVGASSSVRSSVSSSVSSSASTHAAVYSADFDMVASGLFHHRGYTIAGGTSEIQHNIIAKQVLGL